jgi:hypothetical protein
MKKITLFLGLAFLALTSCQNNDDFPTGTGQAVSTTPIAYYPFNGNALDEAGSNDGVVNGPTLTSDINDIPNSAYLFDGIDDMISVPNDIILNVTNEFTISAFVRPEEVKTQDVVRKGANVNNTGTWPYGIGFSETGDIVFTVTTNFGDNINQARKIGYQANRWYLITGVFKNNTMYLYVNGELEATETVSGEVTTNTSPLLIGARLGLPSDTFKGTIDDVRIYDTALELDDILALYNSF